MEIISHHSIVRHLKTMAGHATIRLARPEEAPALTALAIRAKAFWGYDAAFMDACREDLTVSVEAIATCPVYVAEERGFLAGFYQLREHVDHAELVALFVEPELVGRGHGKALWHHAVVTARELGFRDLMLQSEPHAEGFYQAMGAQRVGESESTVFPGRMLPLMRFPLRSGQ